MPIVNYLHTIVVSGYWKEEEWQLWADNLILCNDDLEDWIYEVAFAKNREELLKPLAKAAREQLAVVIHYMDRM